MGEDGGLTGVTEEDSPGPLAEFYEAKPANSRGIDNGLNKG